MSDQLIATHRVNIKLALYEGDIDRAWFHAGIIVGLRICAGELNLKGSRYVEAERRRAQRTAEI